MAHESLTVSELTALGWNDFFSGQLAAVNAAEMEPGRVVGVERTLLRVQGAFGVVQATLSGRLRHASGAFPTVGDWVALQLVGVAEGGVTGASTAVVKHVLSRKTRLSRLASGRRGSAAVGNEQLLAANLDTVFIVSSLGREFNLRRLERYLAAVAGGGARPVILLNKADLCSDAATRLEEVQAVAPEVAVYTLSALEDANFEVLDMYLRPGETVALIGSSGVGKSTLINRLLGREAAPSAEVRAGDGKGRHTTTWREVFVLATGGVLIDNPGLREIGVWSEDVSGSFADISEWAAACAYRDCTHGSEPGCAVQQALRAGWLESERLRNYRALTLGAEQVRSWQSESERTRREGKVRRKGIKAALKAKGR